MSPLAWILGLALPAIGAEGAAGLPPPGLMDMTRIERPATPNTYLAGPADMRLIPNPAAPGPAVPDLVLEPEATTAEAVFASARAVFERQPRTYLAAVFPEHRQVHYVVRSALMNYPDLVTVQVDPVTGPVTGPAGQDRAMLTIWSRSVYGRRDFGVNKQRTDAWLAALRQTNQR